MKNRRFFALFLLSAVALAWPGIAGAAYEPRVVAVEGSVQIKPANATSWQKAEPGMPVIKDTEIRSGAGSSCLVALEADTRNLFRLDPQSEVTVGSVTQPAVLVRSGRVWAYLRRLEKKTTFTVSTPTAVASARGTAWVMDAQSASCFDGSVWLTSFTRETLELKAGHGVEVGPQGRFGEALSLPAAQTSEWMHFAAQVRQNFTREEFLDIRSEKDSAGIRMFMKKDKEEYEVSRKDREGSYEALIRLKEPFVETSRETVEFQEGLIEKVEIVYADLTGTGTKDIAQVTLVSQEPLELGSSEGFTAWEIQAASATGGSAPMELPNEEATAAPTPEASPEALQDVARAAALSSSGGKTLGIWNRVNVQGFGSASNTNVPAMAEFRGALYAGTTNTASGAQLYRSTNGTSWSSVDLSAVSGFSGSTSISALAMFPYPETSSSRLYMGTSLVSTSSSAGSVFVSSDGSTWSALSDATRWAVDTSDGANDSPRVTALVVARKYLFAGISFKRRNAEIWRRPVADDIASWERVLSKESITTLTGGSTYGVVNDLKFFNDNVFAAIEVTSGDSEPVLTHAGAVVLKSVCSSDAICGESGSANWPLAGPRGLV